MEKPEKIYFDEEKDSGRVRGHLKIRKKDAFTVRLKRKSVKVRMAIDAAARDGCTAEEIAEALGVPTSFVREYLNEA